MLRNRNRIRFWSRTGARGNKAAGLHNSIQCTAIDYEIFHHWKTFHPEWLDDDRFVIAEFPHVKLTRGAGMIGTMRFAIDGKRAGAADSLTTIGIERNRAFAAQHQLLVKKVEHFEK